MSTTTSSAPDVPRYADELAEEIEDLQHTGGSTDRALPTDRFIDRERSWLDYSARLLELAEDESTPLLERVRFLAIFAGGLDEFFMVRVAGLHGRLAVDIDGITPAGLSPREQLDLIATRAHELATRHAAAFEKLRPAIANAGIIISSYSKLTGAERDRIDAFFAEHVYPVLTPLAVDPAHPFPYISGLSLNLAVVVHDRESGREHFARVKVPPLLPRFVPVGGTRFVLLEDVIEEHLPDLFPGMEVTASSTFRVTRNEDLALEESDVDNLLAALERELARRRFGPAVRLEVAGSITDRVLSLLVRELGVTESQLYRIDGPLDLGALWGIADLDLPALKYPAIPQVTHPSLHATGDSNSAADVFAAIRQGDILLQHPYDSFTTSVQAFVEQAAADPAVLAIKQTLYRTSGDSPLVDALIDAAEAGKQVLVVVEIKARFDEQANIKWARALERAGCHVVYGLVGLKTHCKLALVVREEPDGTLRRYAHIGTGNYNPKTARIYEDIGLLTADPQVGADIADLFNHLSGYTKHRDYHTLLVAPDSLRPGLLRLIGNEAAHARAGNQARITMKVNSLVDEDVIDALYDASRAGVEIELVVRGMCALRPGVPGLSERIRVRSFVGRLLEHSRIFHFANGGDEQFWIGSADVMHRNLDRRVEALVQVRDPACRAALGAILDLALDDGTAAWLLQPDGDWVRRNLDPAGAPLADFQQTLAERSAARSTEVRTEARA
ncbi:MAG TPA: RNA degradosome polyphosphate kinase [Mycobacteriales bacterium]|nr:RNA degradosome polyphosphate kinase [Mycobacteriales bacterium]